MSDGETSRQNAKRMDAGDSWCRENSVWINQANAVYYYGYIVRKRGWIEKEIIQVTFPSSRACGRPRKRQTENVSSYIDCERQLKQVLLKTAHREAMEKDLIIVLSNVDRRGPPGR